MWDTLTERGRSPLVGRSLRRARRKGLASVLAMLYLVLISTLAVGYYEATVLSAQIARNEQGLSQGQMAADSGMQFVRYQLGAITVPGGTPQSGLLDAVATQLGNILNFTGNMNGHTVQNTAGTIYLPSASDSITLNSTMGTRFQATITQIPSTATLVVKVTGYGSNWNAPVSRGIQLQYQQAQVVGTIFNYGVASKGEISTSAPLTITGATNAARGSVLVASSGSVAINNSGNGSAISGDLSYANAASTNHYGTMTVDGYASNNANFSQHVHAGVAPPQFPTIDSSVFLPYCTTTYSGSTSASNPPPFVNCILPAGSYNFSGNVSIQGVLYIQQPSKVSFSGPVNLQGCIVVDTVNPPQGTSATNYIKFTQTVTATGIDTLPQTSQFPAAERALTGSVILAPNFEVIGTNSFGTVSGSLIAGKFSFSNTFTASVSGSVIQLDDTPMTFTNTSTITLTGNGVTYPPSGVTFGTKYVPSPGSYIEVTP